MSKYVEAEAHDEDDDGEDSEEAGEEVASQEGEDMTDDARIDQRILLLPQKKRETVLKKLRLGGDGDESISNANVKDRKWVLQIIDKDNERLDKAKNKQKKSKSQANTPKKRFFNAYNEDGDGGSGGEGGGERDKEAEKKMRPTKRDLTPLAQIGLGTNDISRHVRGVGGNLRKVFFKRDDLILKGGMVEVEHGPFQIMQIEEWWKNTDKQRLHAERFALPIQDFMPLREVSSSDTVDVMMTPDCCSKALFAFINTHRSTHLDIPRTPQVENICLPQHHGDRKSRILLEQGPQGGSVGVADCLLWKLTVCTDTLTVDPEILQVITLLCKALAGGLDESYAGVATHYTEPSFNTNSRAKVQEGGRYFDEFNSDMLQARGTTSMSHDIDATLLDTLWQYRSVAAGNAELEEDSPCIIPVEHAVNSARVRGQTVPEAEHRHEIIVKKGLFNIFLWSHVMDCADEGGNKRQVRIDLVRIQAKMPGVEPIIFLENASRMETLKMPLLNVIKHMNMALCKPHAMTMGLADVFSVGKSSQLSTVCTEAHVPLAIFNFAHAEGLVNMHFGGMRIDVQDSSEMRLYLDYLKGVELARHEHFRMISVSVAADLSPNGYRHASKPCADFSTQYYQGMHYRSMRLDYLEEQIGKMREAAPEENREDVRVMTECWLHNILKSRDKTWCYIEVGGGMAWNCGVLIKYNPDAFSPYVKPNPKAALSSVVAEITPQPYKCAPVIEVYMEARSVEDQFACLWEDDNKVVLDLEWLQKNAAQLNAQMSSFVEHVHDVATASTMQSLQQTRIFEEEILSLYGVRKNRLDGMLQKTREGGELTKMAGVLFRQTQACIRTTLCQMNVGPLLQFAMAARSVLDLKKQAEVKGALWLRDYVPMRTLVQKRLSRGPAHELLSAESHTAFLFVLARDRVAMDVCFMNESLVQLFDFGMCAQFCSPTAWGMPVQLTDGASTWSITVTQSNGTRAELIQNKKTSGAGADVSTQVKTQNDNAYGRWLVVCNELMAFYNSEKCRDKTAKWVSPMAMATYNGSGVPVTADGSMRIEDMAIFEQAGIASWFTEARKLCGDSEAAQNFLANLENWLGDSGAGEGTKREGWITTVLNKTVSFLQFWPMPAGVVTGNRQESKVPTSTIEGGRMRLVNSSTLDGPVGRIFSVREDEAQEESDDDVMEESFRDNMECSEDVTNVKYMNEERTRNNMVFCLINHMRRKAFPFVNRVMTQNFMRATYVIGIDLRSMGNAVRDISQGLRRAYLKSPTVMNRTWDGPFKTVTLHPSAVTFTIERCLRAAFDAVGTNSKNQPCVPLYDAFENMVLATINVPMSLHCILSALHLWMFATILDASVMILSCYFLFTTGMTTHCPLNILALVATEQQLTPAQEGVYDLFAAYLLETVTMPSVETARVEWASTRARRVRGMGLRMSGHLKEVSKEELIEWHQWEVEGKSHEIKAAMQRRANRQSPSTFVTPGACFVVRKAPEWMTTSEAKGPAKSRESQKFDAATMGSAENIIATAFALMQTKEHDTERGSAIPLQQFEKTDVYWQAASAGTRLPQIDRKTMDDNDLVFAPVWTTGVFYTNTCKNTNAIPGVLSHFLALCNMKKNCTRADVLKKLLLPYMQRKGINRQFLSSESWLTPIVGAEAAPYSCFKWGVMPKEGANAMEGVEVSLNIDILWLILAQGLFAHEWQGQGNQGGDSVAVVHLRNLSCCSLTMLSLFIHSCVERAAIPANSGSIFLNQFNPVTDNPLPAALFYDERLHVDTYLGSVAVLDNQICHRLRKPANFQFLYLEDGTACLYYKNIIAAAEERSSPNVQGDLFMFPPESVYHMQAHLVLMKTAYRRLYAMDIPQADKTLQIAFQLYGNAVTADMVRHIPVSLTHSVTAHKREIPCMSFQQGFLFTLVIEHNMVFIVPTQATSVHDSDTLGLGARIPTALPIKDARGEIIAFSIDRMSEMMTSGLRLCMDDNVREVYLHPLPNDLVGVEMPFSFFPVILWKHAVTLRCSDQILRLDKMPPAEFGGAEPYVRVIHADRWFQYLEKNLMLSLEETSAYLAENKDIPKIKNQLVSCRMTRLTVRDRPDITTFFLVLSPDPEVEARAMVTAPRYLYFNTRSHLKWHLVETKGQPFEAKHNTRWHAATQHLLVPGRNVFSPFDDDNDSGGFVLMYRIETHDKGRTLVLDMADHDDRLVQAELESLSTCKDRVQAVKKWIRDAENGLHEPSDAELDERRQLLTVRSQEHAQQSLRSASVKMTRTVRCHVPLCKSSEFNLEWTLGPMDNWHQDGPTGLGIITKHPALSIGADDLDDVSADPLANVFLRRGQYHVECMMPGVASPVHALMDFATASRCLVREGQSVVLRLDRTRYFELCACVPKCMRRGFVMRAAPDMHESICQESTDFVQLEAFYILGDSAHTDNGKHVIRLAIIVHSLNLMDGSYFYNEHEKHKVIVNVKLVDSDKQAIVTTHKDPGNQFFSNLVYTSKQEAARDNRQQVLADVSARQIWLK